MTVRNIYDAVLIDLQKEDAPSLLLEDFIYYLNKTITAYVNKRYNLFETTQQLTDDLRSLKQHLLLDVEKVSNDFLETYISVLPDNYFHLLDCLCYFSKNNDIEVCPNSNSKPYKEVKATRLPSGMYSNISNNYYFKPSEKQPYYSFYQNTEFDNTQLPVKKKAGSRKSNSQPVKIEIRCGDGNLKKILIEYLKSPQYVSITHSQIESLTDTSQILEFPDYVCNEIKNELVILIMSNISDNRIQSYIPINTTISN